MGNSWNSVSPTFIFTFVHKYQSTWAWRIVHLFLVFLTDFVSVSAIAFLLEKSFDFSQALINIAGYILQSSNYVFVLICNLYAFVLPSRASVNSLHLRPYCILFSNKQMYLFFWIQSYFKNNGTIDEYFSF
jgi:hypothetical protein